MNFLSLAQAVKRESGLGMESSIVSFATAAGDDRRMFQWVNWAARDITLSKPGWRFRRGAATLASTTDQANTPAAFGLTDFASWKPATKTYKPSAYMISQGAGTESELQWLEYDQFRAIYIVGVQTPGVSVNWTISPSNELLLGPAPASAHFVRADYIKDYTDMTADADVPTIPSSFHMLIVWRALMEYGGFDAAGEVYQRAERNYNSSFPQLVLDQTDSMAFAAWSLA